MDTKTQSSSGTGNSPPPQKPWERAGSSSGPVPFKPPSPGSTSDVVEASGTAKPGEIVSAADRNAPVAVAGTALSRPVPTRPWEQQQTYGGGYGASYNTGYGTTGMYGGSSYGGYGGSYGGGLYGNSMYNRGGYGSSMYGGGMYGGGGGMYGGGMYNSGLGGPMGGYGGMGGPYGEQDPNNPYGAPSGPPNFWISLMRVMQGVVNVFGRVAMLIDQNTQALHMFMSAALQLFDRSGLLYGELARFVFRLLGIRTKPRKVQPPGPPGLPGPQNPNGYQNAIEGPKAPQSGGWDNLWGDNAQN